MEDFLGFAILILIIPIVIIVIIISTLRTLERMVFQVLATLQRMEAQQTDINKRLDQLAAQKQEGWVPGAADPQRATNPFRTAPGEGTNVATPPIVPNIVPPTAPPLVEPAPPPVTPPPIVAPTTPVSLPDPQPIQPVAVPPLIPAEPIEQAEPIAAATPGSETQAPHTHLGTTAEPALEDAPAPDWPIGNPFGPPPPASKGGTINWEKFVGENLINKIGIAFLTIGIGIFVKYAIDQNWLGHLGRVLIGIAAGAAMAATGHFMRKEYRAFSAVLVGGAIAVFYFTIGLAFQQYHLMSQATAFAIMVVITGIGVGFSLVYDRIELAVIALVGGFLTPFMVSTGTSNFVVLYSYILLLNTGMLAISWWRKWRLVYLLAFIFTLILFSFWPITGIGPGQHGLALGFATAFYLQLVAATLAFNLRTGTLFYGEDFLQLLTLNMTYFGGGLYIIDQSLFYYLRGAFTLAMAAFNLGLAWFVNRQPATDRNFFYLVLGLGLTFVTLAGPIELHGNRITLFWAAEGALLLWLYDRTGMHLLYRAAWIMIPLTLVSWLIDVEHVYKLDEALPGRINIVFNEAFVSGLAVAALLGAFRYMLGRLEQEPVWAGYPPAQRRIFIEWLIVITAFTTGAIELNYQLAVVDRFYHGNHLQTVALMGYTGLWLCALWVVDQRYLQKYEKPLINASAIYLFLLVVIIRKVYPLAEGALVEHAIPLPHERGRPLWHLLIQYVMVLAALPLGLQLLQFARKKPQLKQRYLWAIGVAGLILFSVQLDIASLLLHPNLNVSNYDAVLDWVHRVVYPVAWALLSFWLVVRGIMKKRRSLRLLGLALFSFTLGKLFFLDVWDMPPGGRITAFILLGLLLLIVSFMYQKLKGLVAAEEEGE